MDEGARHQGMQFQKPEKAKGQIPPGAPVVCMVLPRLDLSLVGLFS